MKKLLASQWAKIVLVVLVLAAVIAISIVGTYFYVSQTARDMPVESEVTAELSPFEEACENIQQLAQTAHSTNGYEERPPAFERVGRTLRKMLSEYPDQLTNETFGSDLLTVEVTDYSLDGELTVRRVQYVIYGIGQFFLEYDGDEKSAFSGTAWYASDEIDFFVFEDDNELLAFSVYPADKNLPNGDPSPWTRYLAAMYTLRDGSLSRHEDTVNIPLRTYALSSHPDKVVLSQEDGTIKARIVYPVESEALQPECIFNRETLCFEIPKANLESESIEYSFPGLLLGLSDNVGNLRTLFIRQEDGRIRCNEYAGEIIFPRKGELFSLKRYSFHKDITETHEEETYRVGSLDIEKLLCGPLGADMTVELKKIIDPNMQYMHCGSADTPLYIGPDYVCYIQNRSEYSGGSYGSGRDHIRFDRYEDLPRFTTATDRDWGGFHLEPLFKEKSLAEHIFGAKTKDLYQSDLFTQAGNPNPYVDFRDLAIKRNIGKWSIMLPVITESLHPGNGSNHRWFSDFAVFSNDVPAALATNREAVQLERSWETSSLKDLFSFPGGSAYVHQYDNYLHIGEKSQTYSYSDILDLDIQVHYEEYIVSINFAGNGEQAKWRDALSKLG